ncbi:MAG: ribonuclease [Hydrogenophilales bacterium CG_4_9_14_3_um_filter_63_34]|nr:MAG: ribonuclease [Hydrogenophilales bacterium CG_4_10_14_3_um_filter_63_21]PJB05912.1 MAG: ribonuclease [Hydrogenophilales bacterium CG_4_9_14_3_um_filter_63_34]
MARKTGSTTQTSKQSSKQMSKLFVLDTNVLLHDPTCLYRFQEHDIYLPMATLEELDHNKKGMTEVARNARQVTRFLDEIVSPAELDIQGGAPLSEFSHKAATGRLFLQTHPITSDITAVLPYSKVDNQILGVASYLKGAQPQRQVILVTKDINMRIKARALGIPAEDYFNDKVLEDTDLLYSGVLELAADFWDKHGRGMESWQKDGRSYYRLSGPLVPTFLINQFVWQEAPNPFQAKVIEMAGDTATLETVKDYSHHKNNVWGITARNREQNFALNVLMDPDVDFVSLLGQAGTGKTLLTLASGLAQILEAKTYSEIIMTRVTVPVGEDIGFLPGTEEEKMTPWMGALEDNLDVLNKPDEEAGEWGRAATQDLVRSRIKVKSLNFMRGRTFINKFLIIDEAQNLTSKQMKTLITRAGPGTKVVCLGNIAQIDTPYLTEGSSGITYVVDRFKGWAHGGHITLARGERSRLADYAAGVL